MPGDRARGWIDLDELCREIARLAEAQAEASGLVGARADVRIDAPGRGRRRISVEVSVAAVTSDLERDRDPRIN
jgi:hypothetical protein